MTPSDVVLIGFTTAYYSSRSDEQVWEAVRQLSSVVLPEELLERMRAFQALSPEQRTEEEADALLRAAGI